MLRANATIVGVLVLVGWGLVAAVRTIGPVQTSIIMCMEPPIVIVCAYLLLGEHLTAIQLLGALLVITGIVLAQRANARR